MAAIRSFSELYDIFKNEVLAQSPDLTDFNEGSNADILAGAFCTALVEAMGLLVDQFDKTFIETANGPTVTGGDDDLQTLAVDHFGLAFARPQAVAAIDVVTFSRATNAHGIVLIPAGTIVKTLPDASGNIQRFSTNSNLTLTASSVATDLTGSVAVTAAVAGSAGSVNSGTVTVIESALTDSTITCTNAGNATGADAQDDATYRETIRNLIQSISGATLQAIEAKALTVTGIETATAVEQATTVIAYNIGAGTTSGSPFTIVKPTLYVADATGSASSALLAQVKTAIESVRACGVLVNVASATPQTINWTASLTLNPGGPNFATFSTDTSQIVQSMKSYINNLPVGTGFVRSTANAALLAIYGPSGTNDITAFTTSVPSGDVSATTITKMVSGTVGTA